MSFSDDQMKAGNYRPINSSSSSSSSSSCISKDSSSRIEVDKYDSSTPRYSISEPRAPWGIIDGFLNFQSGGHYRKIYPVELVSADSAIKKFTFEDPSRIVVHSHDHSVQYINCCGDVLMLVGSERGIHPRAVNKRNLFTFVVASLCQNLLYLVFGGFFALASIYNFIDTSFCGNTEPSIRSMQFLVNSWQCMCTVLFLLLANSRPLKAQALYHRQRQGLSALIATALLVQSIICIVYWSKNQSQCSQVFKVFSHIFHLATNTGVVCFYVTLFDFLYSWSVFSKAASQKAASDKSASYLNAMFLINPIISRLRFILGVHAVLASGSIINLGVILSNETDAVKQLDYSLFFALVIPLLLISGLTWLIYNVVIFNDANINLLLSLKPDARTSVDKLLSRQIVISDEFLPVIKYTELSIASIDLITIVITVVKRVSHF